MNDNMKLGGDSVLLTINSRLYPLETIYSAAYVFLDRAYVLLDGDPEKKILVRLKSKDKEDLNKLGEEFFNELINYADFHQRAKQTRKIREILLQRAIISNDPFLVGQDEDLFKDEEFEDIFDESDDDFLDDSEGMAIPWDENYNEKEGTKEKQEQLKGNVEKGEQNKESKG